MRQDVGPDRQVKEITGEPLKARFAYFLTLDQATPYLQGGDSIPKATAKSETDGNDYDVVFERDRPRLVVLPKGKAVDLILCKG